jgi:hypothetical protein
MAGMLTFAAAFPAQEAPPRFAGPTDQSFRQHLAGRYAALPASFEQQTIQPLKAFDEARNGDIPESEARNGGAERGRRGTGGAERRRGTEARNGDIPESG